MAYITSLPGPRGVQQLSNLPPSTCRSPPQPHAPPVRMLKRQRPASPAPFSPDFAMDLDPSLLTCHKRRRIPQAPDESSRHRRTHSQSEDESDLDDASPSDCSGASRRRDEETPSSSQYKAVNSMLRDLHALHQHRLIFSQPSPTPISFAQNCPAAVPSIPRIPDGSPEHISPFDLFRRDMADATHKSLHPHVDHSEDIRGRYEGVNRSVDSDYPFHKRLTRTFYPKGPGIAVPHT